MKFYFTLLLSLVCLAAQGANKRIILLAGHPSHGKGEHEFNAGCHLIKECLDKIPGVTTEIYNDGWPKNEAVLNGAAAIFSFADGGEGHPFNRPERLALIDSLMKQGVGLGCGHYAVEVPKGPAGDKFLEWIGGYFEMNWSVNPTWDAHFTQFPKHPITRGVKPFHIMDEWYYHMRFPADMARVTPILSEVPPKNTVQATDSTHGGNPAVRAAVAKGEPQHLMWAIERPDGGRGFGFTGAHYHKNWGDPNFRKLLLNAILWSAKVPVPENGVECSVSDEDLKKNLDKK
jgi:type 1 glutamine amidotransferase